MLPFTAGQFFGVFAAYNEGVWPAQWALLALAVAGLLLARRGSAAASRGASLVLALLWAWMALAYHLAYFAAINPAARLFAAFFLTAALAFAGLGVARERLRFARDAPHSGVGWALVAIALVLYPALGLAVGHRYPAFPTFGLPCPTTIFTLGLLHFALRPVPRLALAIPLLWSAIGTVAALRMGVWQDLLLLFAGLVSLATLGRRKTARLLDGNQSHLGG